MKELMDSLATNHDVNEMPGAEHALHNPLETKTDTKIDDDSKTDDDRTKDKSDAPWEGGSWPG